MDNCTDHKTCIEDALREAERICAEKKLNFTKQRKKVLELVWKNHKPAKAYDILKQIDEKDSLQPPIVYRALDFLLNNGMVHKINSLNAYVGCPHPLKHSQCYFLICSKCEEVEESCDKSLTAEIAKSTKSRGFNSEKVAVEIVGICKKCQKPKKRV